MPSRLVIVSNRLPVTVRLQDGESVLRESVGGLASGLRTPHEDTDGVWIGWPGQSPPTDPAAREWLRRELEARRLVAVDLTEHEVAGFYEHISNSVLWPICHDRLDRMPLRIEGWDVYESVNARFADAVVERHRPGDTIWVHDYQLLRVPALIRARIPDARIGFFLHIPFPNPEIFFALPPRAWLIEGMMGADVIGFHTRRYHGHFRAALRRLFSVEAAADGTADWNGRRVRLGVFPIGVDAADIARRASAPRVTAKMEEYRGADGQRILLGVDRLDYSKGLPRRLLAFERLLETHPEWQTRVRLIQVAVPSRDQVGAYRDFRREVDALVGRINGRFATPNWMPIHYLYRSVGSGTLLALYRAADVMLVTPLRDGMNLVAKEFAASRIDEDGVLVLSEFAGAAETLTDALLVNPYDVDGTAQTIHRALVMDPTERSVRMRALRERVQNDDVHRWVARFRHALEG